MRRRTWPRRSSARWRRHPRIGSSPWASSGRRCSQSSRCHPAGAKRLSGSCLPTSLPIKERRSRHALRACGMTARLREDSWDDKQKPSSESSPEGRSMTSTAANRLPSKTSCGWQARALTRLATVPGDFCLTYILPPHKVGPTIDQPRIIPCSALGSTGNPVVPVTVSGFINGSQCRPRCLAPAVRRR